MTLKVNNSECSMGVKNKKYVAFLRFSLDTLGENFIYEEGAHLKNYCPVFLCGLVKRLDKKINYYCHSEFIKLYQRQWPEISRSQGEIYRKGIAKYQDIVKRLRITLFHAQFLTDAFFYYPLIKKCNLPLIVNLRGYDLFHPKMGSFLTAVSPFVSKFLVKSESMKDVLVSLGCAREKIEVVYGGVDVDKITFKPRLPADNSIKILSAGRFVDKKGYDVTLKFFRRLLKFYPNATLTLVGEGELRAYLIKLVDRLGIIDRVSVKEYMTHSLFIKELYRHNLFVLPSRTAKNGDREGIPNVLKEAMASGMLVISTYHSGIPELISDRKTGYLVEENDDAGMLDKLNFILQNNKRASQVCLNARAFVEKKFDVKNTAAQIEGVYDHALRRDRGK